MVARILSRSLISLGVCGILPLGCVTAVAQPPTLPAIDPPPAFVPADLPLTVTPMPASPRTVNRAPATMAWLGEEGKAIVSLKDGSQIRGTVDGLSTIDISTSFGDLSIPSKMVEQIALNEDVNLSTVEYKGDRLTGVIELPTLRMTTSWGDVSIREDQLKRFPLSGTGAATSDPYRTSPVYAIPATPYALPVPPPPTSRGYASASGVGVPAGSSVAKKLRFLLEDKSVLVGTLERPEKIPIRLAFGNIEIPVETVSWLKRSDGSTKVRLANGDRVTGDLEIDEWTIEGVLGTVRLEAKKVAAVRRGVGRNRWIMRPVTEITPGGEAVTRYVAEMVEEFDDEPDTPASSWSRPVPAPAVTPAPPRASYTP